MDLAPEHVDDFMWMFEVELDRNHRIHAYKHYWTRRYIHLDHEGRAFAYCGDELYQEVDPLNHLDLVLQKEREGPPTYDIVRQNIWTGGIEISWTRSATKRRISRKRSAYVIENCDLFLVELEVIALELEKATLLVIHAMRLRASYRERYEEIKRWRR
ncbi:MAG: ribonuclease VapC [Solirubrobacterales bacterium]|nr:ribonuclease VapC [Solirubrobacterales bacterium]